VTTLRSSSVNSTGFKGYKSVVQTETSVCVVSRIKFYGNPPQK